MAVGHPREEFPDEVYARDAAYVKLAMKHMTAKRMVGWLREYAEFSDLAGNTTTADHARHVADRLEREVEPDDGGDAQ